MRREGRSESLTRPKARADEDERGHWGDPFTARTYAIPCLKYPRDGGSINHDRRYLVNGRLLGA